MSRWLDQQREEMAIKREELQLRGKSLDLSASQAEQAIKAQVTDREGERRFKLDALRMVRTMGLVFAIGLLALCAYSLHLGKESVIADALKTFGLVAAVAFGAFQFGKKRGANEIIEEASSSSSDD